ncbi:MAG: hypothetical protein L6R41_000182 [Letrouitia leprolyta]|nr:MAG: hypothetical protein L6R41_000182 [Letrouitia leprolyta]
MVALSSHNEHLAPLIAKALPFLPPENPGFPSISVRYGATWLQKQRPDFISITRGPGLLPSLSSGLQTAKGLAVAWQIPLIGVNHMQAHALTPRLMTALESAGNGEEHQHEPAFPFLSLLVSGGHTMLVHSKALTHHSILASTIDIAAGDVIDKAARSILPPEIIENSEESMYGRLLENFVFLDQGYDEYTAPSTLTEELSSKPSKWGWALPVPLSGKERRTEFSFTGLGSAVERICDRKRTAMSFDERVGLAGDFMRIVFEHLASRVILALNTKDEKPSNADIKGKIATLVVSGGVASNQFLRRILRSFLDVRGYSHIRLIFPPPSLCTDNAAMIAWTGIEMYEAGYESDLRCKAIRKWSIDPDANDGGILGADNWKRRH